MATGTHRTNFGTRDIGKAGGGTNKHMTHLLGVNPSQSFSPVFRRVGSQETATSSSLGSLTSINIGLTSRWVKWALLVYILYIPSSHGSALQPSSHLFLA